MKLATRVVLIFIWGIAQPSKGQNYSIDLGSSFGQPTYSNANQFLAFAEGVHTSNSINNSIALSLFAKQDLKGKWIENNLDRLKKTNSLEMTGSFGFHYLNKRDSLFKHPRLRYGLGWSRNLHIFSRYNEELFRLAFKGNSAFAGKIAPLDDFRYQQFRYEKFTFSVRNTDRRFNINFSVVRGLDHIDARIDQSSIFTEEIGRFIDVDAAFNMKRTEYRSLDPFITNGIGGAIDFNFKIWDGANSMWLFTDDIGWVNWNNSSSEYIVDSTFRFEGWFIPNISEIGDDGFLNGVTDSLENTFGIMERQKSYSTSLPTTIGLKGRYAVSGTGSILYRLSQNLIAEKYIPHLNISYENIASEQYSYSVGASYGGYGGLDINLGTIVHFKRFVTGLQVWGVEGIIAPNKLSGMGASTFISFPIIGSRVRQNKS